jgi:hypothetical protein
MRFGFEIKEKIKLFLILFGAYLKTHLKQYLLDLSVKI